MPISHILFLIITIIIGGHIIYEYQQNECQLFGANCEFINQRQQQPAELLFATKMCTFWKIGCEFYGTKTFGVLIDF